MKWNSIMEMLKALNKKCNYLIIRNYELLENDKLIDEHEDIDILCDNTELLVKTLGATPRHTNDSIHFFVYIREQKISVDVRTIGDTYYDEKWEQDMLVRRVIYKNLFYVPSIEDYYYSLIYHGLFHKESMKKEYVCRLEAMANDMRKKFQIEQLQRELEEYMKIHNYKKTGYKSL